LLHQTRTDVTLAGEATALCTLPVAGARPLEMTTPPTRLPNPNSSSFVRSFEILQSGVSVMFLLRILNSTRRHSPRTSKSQTLYAMERRTHRFGLVVTPPMCSVQVHDDPDVKHQAPEHRQRRETATRFSLLVLFCGDLARTYGSPRIQ
jgi:hypothetical protein